MAKKIICDVCGKECLERRYIIPMYIEEAYKIKGGKNNSVLSIFTTENIERKDVDLCGDCRIKLAQLIKVLPAINYNQDYTIRIYNNEENIND